MRIGVPREIKVHEYRVGLVPAGVRELVAAGHEVLVESGAGNGIGVDDAQFRAVLRGMLDGRARCCSPTCTWPPTRCRQGV